MLAVALIESTRVPKALAVLVDASQRVVEKQSLTRLNTRRQTANDRSRPFDVVASNSSAFRDTSGVADHPSNGDCETRQRAFPSRVIPRNHSDWVFQDAQEQA